MNGAALAGFALAALILLAALPFDAWLDSVRGWIAGLGAWEPVAFILSYGVAATIFIPASALSLAAGALFGLLKGSLLVWLGANTATVASFLVARFAARSRVEAIAQTRPRFAAVDRAMAEEGWKIVALMRLSPLFPFSLQNYLFGVTAIPFWPYAAASAAFMIPGTFLYVYIGYAGGQAAAVAGGVPGANAAKLALQAVGLLATVLATFVLARIASRAIARHAPAASSGDEPAETAGEGRRPSAKPALLLGIAIALLVAALAAFAQRDAIRERFYPPRVQITERYAQDLCTEAFNHGVADTLLAGQADANGPVEHLGIAASCDALAGYAAAFGAVAGRYPPELARPANGGEVRGIQWLTNDCPLSERTALSARPASGTGVPPV